MKSYLRPVCFFLWLLCIVAVPRIQGQGLNGIVPDSPLISVTYKNANVRAAITTLFKTTQLKYTLEDTVQGDVTVQITDQPFSVALRTLLKAARMPLTYIIQGGVYQIRGREPILHFQESSLSGVVSAKSILETIRTPTKVTLYRISRTQSPGASEELLNPVILNPSEAQTLSKVLFESNAVHWPILTECGFNPIVLARFERITLERDREKVWPHTDCVDVRFCFDCHILSVETVGKDLVILFHFGTSEAAILKAAQKAFPNDSVLQQAKARPGHP